jgi:hypothetical protein
MTALPAAVPPVQGNGVPTTLHTTRFGRLPTFYLVFARLETETS